MTDISQSKNIINRGSNLRELEINLDDQLEGDIRGSVRVLEDQGMPIPTTSPAYKPKST